MDKEVVFGQKLMELRRLVNEREAFGDGEHLTEEEIRALFADLDLTQEQMNMVLEYARSREAAASAAVSAEGPSDEPAATEDPDGTPQPDAALDPMSETERDYLQMYLDDLELLPVLTAGEKQALTIAAMAGERDAQKRLTEGYLKDVAQIAKLYTGQGVLIEDLIGEGNVALSVGVTMLGSQEKSEECEGVLMKLVMDAMEDLISENRGAEESAEKAVKNVNRVYEKAKDLSEDLGKKLTIEELMELGHFSRKTVEDAIRISGGMSDVIM
ncbi:MAG: hypothetical protein K6E92_07040 [Lachnospiraceae bacterium]|nr:hypothetical protein [Lachnospiraceae bacterium]